MALAIYSNVVYFVILDHSLALRKQKCTLQIEGVGNKISSHTRGRAGIEITSIIDPAFKLNVEFHIIDSITSPTPVAPIANHCWQHLRNLPLADPKFGATNRVEALLGADVWGQILVDGLQRGSNHEPVAQRTRLGWIVFGPAEATTIGEHPVQTMSIKAAGEDIRVDKLLHTIFDTELNGMSLGKEMATIDPCEKLFKATFKRNRDGRYSVQMPFRNDARALGNSHSLALRQFHQLERKLASNPELKGKYVAFMQNYEELGHMYAIPDQPGDPSQCYYIPHHAVTAKFRVVFNASAKTSNGTSLNDTQLAGPPLQDLLVHLIHRFRQYSIALTADVEKMFRQVRIDKRHRKWQQILWRASLTEPIRTYQLATVTYGTTSGPYLAIRAMQQCGKDNCHVLIDYHRVQMAFDSIHRDFYVDDFLTSRPTIEEATELAMDVSTVLGKGQFHLRKWRSNSTTVLTHMFGASNVGPLDLSVAETTVLGLHWDPSADALFYHVHLDESPSITKRQALSDAARLYDPTGMLAPVLLLAKLFIQKLWQAKLAWDTPLPPDLLQEWLTFRNQLPQLEAVRIPRWLGRQHGIVSHLHGFCDASTKAYAAVLYLCTTQPEGNCINHLIASKTRVAPLHATTIPRLELCAAHLLVDLAKEIQRALQLDPDSYTLWSDSNIVLHWLRKNTSQLKQYVANRVGFIQQNSIVEHWHHIRTKLNPADCASRGIQAPALLNHHLLWRGPSSENYPITELHTLSDEDTVAMEAEFKPVKSKIVQASSYAKLATSYKCGDEFITVDLVDRFSSLGKLLRTTAYILRWAKSHRQFRASTHVTVLEMTMALQLHIRTEQQAFFKPEINHLRQSKCVAPTSKLLTLAPFIDADSCHILRVGGRLDNAMIDHEQRHPIILPKESSLARLIIWQIHIDTLHGGIQLMLHTLRQKYWILQARTLVKQCVHSCVVCRRHKHQMAAQRMASLPTARVTPAPPFSVSGVDYCGPFNIRIGSKNVRTVKKTYVAIFVCMVTKAVHIELAEDLSAEAFINVFTRFVNRRGPCNELYSDNGTAFVGANRTMQEDLQEWHNEYTHQQLAHKGTNWHFIPPGAPHQGGLWEAAVKSAKRHLLRIVGTQSIYYDQLHALLVHIEACLNSRPLIALHDTPDGKLALSPADFLVGRSIVATPDPPLGTIPTNRLSYWRQLRQMQQHFWQQWHDEYLSTLQPRSKWHQNNDNINLGDIVIIRHENLPSTHWRLGKVITLHPGKDGLVRVVTIKHADGECTRPIQKVCRLVDSS